MMPSRASGHLTFAKLLTCFLLLWTREQVVAFQRVSSSALVLQRHSIDCLALIQGGRLQRIAAYRDALRVDNGDNELQSSHESVEADSTAHGSPQGTREPHEQHSILHKPRRRSPHVHTSGLSLVTIPGHTQRLSLEDWTRLGSWGFSIDASTPLRCRGAFFSMRDRRFLPAMILVACPVNAAGDEGEGQEASDDDGAPFPIWEGIGAFQAGEMDAPPPMGVVIVDGFCDYLGRRCARLLKEAGYAVVEVMSEHMLDVVMRDEEANVFRPPEPGSESRWAAHLPFPLAAVLCESDAGLATAERLQATLLGPRFGGINEARRDKFLMNEAIREAGLTAVRQVKTGHWDEVRSFLSTLRSSSVTRPRHSGSRTDTDGAALPTARAGGVVSCVVKPLRGCASGGVFRCSGEQEAEVAFRKILGTRKYGTPGAMNDEVLVQELLEGVEFAVDTVSRDGEHKVMAIWRYDKRPANGAPFVYFSTQLMRSDGAQEQRLVEYVRQVLDTLGVTFGPTHTEVMMVGAPSGNDASHSPLLGMPVLVEVNTRWHLTDFAPVTDACVGYNAVEETLSAYLDPERFAALPRDPPVGVGAKHGRVVHLVSYVEGSLEGIDHEEEIHSMKSFAGIDVYSDPEREGNGQVKRTVDIRSDAGWVHLVHESADVIERDYARIVELMPTMFRVRAAEGGCEDARATTGLPE